MRAQRYAMLTRQWWRLLMLILVPLPLAARMLSESEPLNVPPLLVFVLGLASLFVTLPFFRRYKHALIAVGRARDGSDEGAAWNQLGLVWRRGLLAAGLPAWIAVIGLKAGLESVPLFLLWISSAVLLWLYRPPRQLV